MTIHGFLQNCFSDVVRRIETLGKERSARESKFK
jgi:hypothetical protein